MTLGLTPRHGGLPGPAAAFCEGRVAPGSIYALLHRECFTLLPDEMFADLFAGTGRGSVPPMIVAVVMVLQRLEGLSDREAADRFCFDVRWKYAAGGLDFDYPGFVHTVLVDMRARLAASARPGRIFEVTLEVGRAAGLIGRRRVLDSTPVYDAVATMDTVTLIRSAVRGLLAVAGDLTAELRGLLRRDDDYASAGKPACDYDDPAARQALVDALATDARALLAGLDGRELDLALARAAALLASVTGQDLDQSADGVFRIARRVARDRIISTVDPEARHGRKTSARGFDGYKGHIATDPDAELITATAVTPANAGDAAAAADLLAADLPARPDEPGPGPVPATDAPATAAAAAPADDDPAGHEPGEADEATGGQPAAGDRQQLAVYGDAAYGAGELLDTLEQAGADIYCKVQPPVAPGGRFTKDAFSIDLAGGAVTCPAGQTAPLRPFGDGRIASFGAACASCPLASRCTKAKEGRSIYAGPYEQQLARARARQRDPDWKAGYAATRPKVERKIAHLMRRRHGGRRARVRGRLKVAADFALLAAAVNLARLGVLEVTYRNGAWAAGGG
jgi:DDE family transposase/transposase-like protein DUF772